jgi:hypothetical protein
MQHEVSHVKEMVMDSERDEEKNYASEDMEDDEPRPPSRLSSISQIPNQIFPPAALKMRMIFVMWQVNSHSPACGHCPLNPKGV